MSSTLSIIVTAKDDASSTLKKVAANGRAVGTSLASASARGASSIAAVDTKARGFTATLKSVGKFVGVAFAVTEVVRWGKESLHAYEALEKEQRLIEGGLRRIGAANQFPQVKRDLKAVSDQTVTLQGDTAKVASAVLNTGHAYFQSLGPSAGRVLAGITQGILNISAATHKSLGMLQRSMTLAVVNTPDKAIPMLKKLGVASAEDARQWTAMAKAGHLNALRTAEVEAITKSQAGAARESATAGDRFAKSMDDLRIKAGRVLTPLMKGAAAIASFAANNAALVLTLVGAAGLKFALGKIIPALVAARGGVGALTMGVAGLGARIASINPVTIAATAGIAALSFGYEASKANAARYEDAVSRLTDAILRHGRGSKQYRDVVQNVTHDVNGWWNTTARVVSDANDRAAHHVRRTGVAVDSTGRIIHRFAGMTQKDFHKWSASIKEDARKSIGSLGGVELATRKTAKQFLHDSDRMARAARQDAAAMRKLASGSQLWVPEGYKKWLVAQGPGAVANFEKLTTKSQRQAVADWRASAAGAAQYGKALDKLSPAGILRAQAASDKLARTLEDIARRPYYIDVYLRQHGSVPNGTGGTPPPADGNAVTSGFSSAPVVNVGGQRVSVGVSIDRRRFVDQMDYETTYRGF